MDRRMHRHFPGCCPHTHTWRPAHAHVCTCTNELLDTDETRDRCQARRARVGGVPGAISCQGTPTPLTLGLDSCYSLCHEHPSLCLLLSPPQTPGGVSRPCPFPSTSCHPLHCLELSKMVFILSTNEYVNDFRRVNPGHANKN